MNLYRVSEVYQCIQGEGRFSGDPMVIVRLQGCSVGCPWCDTKHSWPKDPFSTDATPPALTGDHDFEARGQRTATELLECVRRAARGRALSPVLVTGGEPAEQDLSELATTLSKAGLALNLETSGTADGHMATRDLWSWVCVSPKEGMPGGRRIIPEVITSADELKFVIGRPEHVEQALAFLDSHQREGPRPVVSLQPLSANQKATQLCVNAAMNHGFRVSLQQHKMLGVP